MPIDVSDLELPGLVELPGYADGQVSGAQLHALLEGLDPATLVTDRGCHMWVRSLRLRRPRLSTL